MLFYTYHNIDIGTRGDPPFVAHVFASKFQFLFKKRDAGILTVPISAFYRGDTKQLVRWDVESDIIVQSYEIDFTQQEKLTLLSSYSPSALSKYINDDAVRFSYGARFTAHTAVFCHNGYYAANTPEGVIGFFYGEVQCEVCPAGTFNTCKSKESCYFHPRQSGEDSYTWKYRIKTEY